MVVAFEPQTCQVHLTKPKARPLPMVVSAKLIDECCVDNQATIDYNDNTTDKCGCQVEFYIFYNSTVYSHAVIQAINITRRGHRGLRWI